MASIETLHDREKSLTDSLLWFAVTENLVGIECKKKYSGTIRELDG
jgi:hypothetical protein